MKTRRLIANGLIAGFFALAIGLAGFGFYSFQKNLTALNKSNQENILWSATQLELEMLKFQEALLKFDLHDGFEGKELLQRFDILWSRVAIFQRGQVGERLRQYDAETNIVGRLFAELQNQVEFVESLDSSESVNIQPISDIFAQFLVEMRGLNKAIFVGEEKIRSDLNSQMRLSANTTLTLSIVSVLFLLLGLGYSSWQGRRFRILAASNRKLADIAQLASQSKTRFLTMMSHELRTPMNGVLGLLALLRQSKISDPQDHIIEQAERSGRQMIGMLTDILDFSALQNDDIELEVKSFELVQLSDALSDLFAPEARRAGIKFSVNCAKNGPLRIDGDFRRLKQVYAQLAGYFVDLAGVRAIAMDFVAFDNMLRVEIGLEYANGGKAWTPDLVMGGRAEGTDSFAADALGPAVARGLIAKMGGEILLRTGAENHVFVVVEIPVTQRRISVVNVQMEMSSDVMSAICKTALRGAPVSFDPPELKQDVHVILYETGGMDEADRVAKLQQKFSHALLIAIGRPMNPDLFDSVIPVPSEISVKIAPVISSLAS